jgi:GT2 family glycosyltransferase/tetratricopeptide (TPR) repeat protein
MSKRMLLSLNIIVAAGEEIELKRCLELCKGDLFDEICITIAAKEMDENVKKVAEEYTDNITFFEWINDFSAARNFNFAQSHCVSVLWLDADDGITPDNYKKLLDLKPSMSEYDVILIQYIYATDKNKNPIVVLPRERIVKNCDKIRWHDPIHEYLDMDPKFKMRKEDDIFITHLRTKPFDSERNLDILRQEYLKPGCSPRVKFYYGKELADTGVWEEAIPVLEDCINSGEGFKDNLAIAAMKLSRYYYSIKNNDAAKAIALKGISFSKNYAEHYVLLGDVYWAQKDTETAIKYYKEAMTKTLGTAGMSQLADYYKFIPCWRLASVYAELRDYNKALRYCDAALECKPDRKELIELRYSIIRCSENNKIDTVMDDTLKKSFKELADKLNLKLEIEDNNVEFARMKITKTNTIKIAWLLTGSSLYDPSTRIRRYNIHTKLKSAGINSILIDNYKGKNLYELRNVVGDSNVIVFTMLGLEEFELMKYFKSLGKKIVYDFNEAIFGYPMQHECFKECDLIACCSTELAEMVVKKGYHPVCVVKDAVEDLKIKPSAIYEDRYDKPKAVYMGMGGNSFLVTEYLKDTIEKAGYELVVITEWDNATAKWDINTWPQLMCECDVVLCPQRVDVQPAKSNVKVTTAMDLGLPVIASPLRAYKEIIKHGKNGFLCDKQEEWYEALVRLKDPEFRKKIGLAGKKAIESYSLEKIATDWCLICDHLISGGLSSIAKKPKDIKDSEKVKAREQVDIIIPNYNNVEYLKLCISSIMMNTLYPFHIIISDAGSNEETWEYLKTLKGITILGKQGERKNFSQACNAGIAHSRSKYFAILNSDLIVSKCWLTNLVDKMESINRLAACGVLSNCDRGWLHGTSGKPQYPMKLIKANVELFPGMKYGQIKPHIDELYQFMADSNANLKGQFVDQSWVATYCTIFARSAVEEVGYFDTSFRNGCEDLDLCRRLQKFDYKIGQAIDSFVFHFGGVSRGAYESENKESYQKEDTENHLMFKAKWDKERIMIWTGPAWEPWNKAKVDEGMAGSETWATYLADAFTKKGYDVIVYNDLLIDDKEKMLFEPVEGSSNTVKYRHYSKLEEDVRYLYVDYFISSRSVAPFKYKLHTHHHYTMIHDVFLNLDPNFDVMPWKVEKYACLSEWHKQFLMKHHKIPENKLFLTANGVVQELYSDVDTYVKKNKMIYSSSCDRGLYQLLLMFPKIKEQVPDFELFVAYGFFNWKSMCKNRNDTGSLILIEKIEDLLKQPGVIYLDRVDKKTLAHHQKESKVWLMPEWFHETFSITAVENGLAKNALLTTDLGGLKTTVGGAGILLSPEGLSRDNVYPESYVSKFIEESVKLLKDEDYRLKWAYKAHNKMKEYNWDKIADGWVEQFKGI